VTSLSRALRDRHETEPAKVTSAVGTELRHEVKFTAYAIEYESLCHWLRMHPSGFVKSYLDRQVNNVYSDSWNYRAFAELLADVPLRLGRHSKYMNALRSIAMV
jgi:hypothetical protein